MKAVMFVAAIAITISAPALASTHYVGQELASKTRISIVKARAIALHAQAGAITDQELEKEAGGSGLRYSFDIKSRGKTFEVGVDAKTGRILENQAEGKNPD